MITDAISDLAVNRHAGHHRMSVNGTRHRRYFRSRLLVAIVAVFALAAVACGSAEPEGEISQLTELPFPAELQNGSEPLDPSAVVTAYIAYFSGARLTPREAVESGRASAMTDYCSDLTGQVIRNPPISGAVFTWNIRKPDDGAWNNVLLTVNFVDPTVPERLGSRKGSLISIPWGPDTLKTTAVFRSPLCAR